MREGWLEAVEGSLFGFGDMEKLIGTQDRSATQLLQLGAPATYKYGGFMDQRPVPGSKAPRFADVYASYRNGDPNSNPFPETDLERSTGVRDFPYQSYGYRDIDDLKKQAIAQGESQRGSRLTMQGTEEQDFALQGVQEASLKTATSLNEVPGAADSVTNALKRLAGVMVAAEKGPASRVPGKMTSITWMQGIPQSDNWGPRGAGTSEGVSAGRPYVATNKGDKGNSRGGAVKRFEYGGSLEAGSYIISEGATRARGSELSQIPGVMFAAAGGEISGAARAGHDSIYYDVAGYGIGGAVLMPNEAIIPPEFAHLGPSLNHYATGGSVKGYSLGTGLKTAAELAMEKTPLISEVAKTTARTKPAIDQAALQARQLAVQEYKVAHAARMTQNAGRLGKATRAARPPIVPVAGTFGTKLAGLGMSALAFEGAMQTGVFAYNSGLFTEGYAAAKHNINIYNTDSSLNDRAVYSNYADLMDNAENNPFGRRWTQWSATMGHMPEAVALAAQSRDSRRWAAEARINRQGDEDMKNMLQNGTAKTSTFVKQGLVNFSKDERGNPQAKYPSIGAYKEIQFQTGSDETRQEIARDAVNRIEAFRNYAKEVGYFKASRLEDALETESQLPVSFRPDFENAKIDEMIVEFNKINAGKDKSWSNPENYYKVMMPDIRNFSEEGRERLDKFTRFGGGHENDMDNPARMLREISPDQMKEAREWRAKHSQSYGDSPNPIDLDRYRDNKDLLFYDIANSEKQKTAETWLPGLKELLPKVIPDYEVRHEKAMLKNSKKVNEIRKQNEDIPVAAEFLIALKESKPAYDHLKTLKEDQRTPEENDFVKHIDGYKEQQSEIYKRNQKISLSRKNEREKTRIQEQAKEYNIKKAEFVVGSDFPTQMENHKREYPETWEKEAKRRGGMAAAENAFTKAKLREAASKAREVNPGQRNAQENVALGIMTTPTGERIKDPAGTLAKPGTIITDFSNREKPNYESQGIIVGGQRKSAEDFKSKGIISDVNMAIMSSNSPKSMGSGRTPLASEVYTGGRSQIASEAYTGGRSRMASEAYIGGRSRLASEVRRASGGFVGGYRPPKRYNLGGLATGRRMSSQLNETARTNTANKVSSTAPQKNGSGGGMGAASPQLFKLEMDSDFKGLAVISNKSMNYGNPNQAF